jgi:hypothetical protein
MTKHEHNHRHRYSFLGYLTPAEHPQTGHETVPDMPVGGAPPAVAPALSWPS